MVTPIVFIAPTPPSESTMTLLTVLTVLLQTTSTQPGTMPPSSSKCLRRSSKREPTLDRWTTSSGPPNSRTRSLMSEQPSKPN
jgi:hypothetical protein